MREIRIWDGQKYHYPEANENETNHHLQIGSNGFFSLWDGEGNFITSSEKGGIIEWSTGLLDCKGNRIFEGDILNEKYTVVFNNGSFMKYNGVAYYELNETSIKIWELETTGNIRESLTPNTK